jgi:tRNA-guanine family transglycosylase
VRAGEITGAVLATLHNVRYYLDFMAALREGIRLGTLADLTRELYGRYLDGGSTATTP